jgi:hypothetical protein
MFLGISSKPFRRRLRKLINHWHPQSNRAVIRPTVLQSEKPYLYAEPSLPECVEFSCPENVSPPNVQRLNSCLVRARHMDSQAFRYWMTRLQETPRYHRKLWEFCYLCQALYERQMLQPGKRGLGFAVGLEPLPALFASMGCEILASDLPTGDERASVWNETAQWAPGLEKLNTLGICPPDDFARRVKFRGIDMNKIPRDVTGFDFTWSSCSFEHCGSIQLGSEFIWNQMECLKPGGIAVHTTEFNLSSNDETLSSGTTVIFRRRDIEQMVERLRAAGHSVEPLDLSVGSHELDNYVDEEPYTQKRHLRLHLGKWASTSIGLIIRKRA